MNVTDIKRGAMFETYMFTSSLYFWLYSPILLSQYCCYAPNQVIVPILSLLVSNIMHIDPYINE